MHDFEKTPALHQESVMYALCAGTAVLKPVLAKLYQVEHGSINTKCC